MVLREEVKGLEKSFLDLCQDIVTKNDLELYDLDYFPSQQLLRVYIQDKETKTAQMEDCVKIDRAMTEPIDTLDWMPETLNLEVSSPGLYRSLRKRQQFKDATGKRVKIVALKKASDHFSSKYKGEGSFIGLLHHCDEESVSLDMGEDVLNFKYENIKKANLEPHIEKI